MNKLFKLFGSLIIGLGTIMMVGVFSVIGGTIVFWLWPVTIPTAFPGLVENGTLAMSLPWWGAVALTWLMGILVRSKTTNNGKLKPKKKKH